MATDNRQREQDGGGQVAKFLGRNHLPVSLFLAFLLGCLAVSAIYLTDNSMRVFAGLIWSFAFAAIGILLGFIFAIPRVAPLTEPEDGGGAASPGARGDGEPQKPARPAARAAAASEVNSNLVEVSDWLTKIIVGVGLVELKDIPENAESLATFIAPSLGVSGDWGTPLAGGIMLYFSVLGFLAGYLLTRVYIALMFKHAEFLVSQQGRMVRLESGREIRVEDLSRMHQAAIQDVQRQVANIAAGAGLTENVTTSQPTTQRRVLWVDDNPDNNALIVEQITASGTAVDQARSGQEALHLFAPGKYLAVISDMGRREADGRFLADAGLQLIKAIRQIAGDQPIVVFCSRTAAEKYGKAAMDEGARLVTTSSTLLLSELKKVIPNLY